MDMAPERFHERSAHRIPPRQVWRMVAPFLEKAECAEIDLSPDNKVVLHNGVLSKRYEFTRTDYGMEMGSYAMVRYSSDLGFSIHISGGAGIWRKATGTALRYFKADVRKAAESDQSIAAFARKNPELLS